MPRNMGVQEYRRGCWRGTYRIEREFDASNPRRLGHLLSGQQESAQRQARRIKASGRLGAYVYSRQTKIVVLHSVSIIRRRDQSCPPRTRSAGAVPSRGDGRVRMLCPTLV